jgi:hypothetical protein
MRGKSKTQHKRKDQAFSGHVGRKTRFETPQAAIAARRGKVSPSHQSHSNYSH